MQFPGNCSSARKRRCCCGFNFMMLGLRGNGHASAHSQNLSAMTVPTSNGNGNGHITKTTMNASTSQSHTSRTETFTDSQTRRNSSRTVVGSGYDHTHIFTADQQVTILRQTVITTRSKLIGQLKLSHINEEYIDSMTLESFVEYIEYERLTNMPHRGSRWDKVLKWAEFFAAQIGDYEEVVSPFVRSSKSASRLIWAACRVLIELGPDNAAAIETAFEVFYKVALSLRFFNLHNKLLSQTSRIRSEVGQAFNDLLVLVSDVAIFYRIQTSSIISSSVSLDFTSRFGGVINDFYSRKNHIIEAMWTCSIDDDSINIHAVRSWLSIRDSTVQTLLRDRAATRSRRDEYTCDWFQTPLLDFSRGKGYKSPVLAVTGPSGCGKSILSGWIVERLQRPLGKKTHETLTIFIDPDLPKECTELAVAKRFALQLLQTNIGDAKLLGALAKAYQASLGWTESNTLEKAVWDAIDIGLEFEATNLMIVIDGLDRCAPQNCIDIGKKIVELTSRHSHVKAIVIARDAKFLPAGEVSIFTITPDHTHNDVQHIVQHELKQCQHFLNQSPKEKQEMVEKITTASQGNFLWPQLSIRSLKLETSVDSFNKAVEAVKKSPAKTLEVLIRELINKSTNNLGNIEARLIISWLLVSRRPLTLLEIKSLLRVDLQKKHLATRSSDTADDIREACGAIITVQNGIVRFRHGAIRDVLLKIANEDKKDRKLDSTELLQAQFATRLLAYCKFRLNNPFQTTFDCPDHVDMGTVFMQDALLEYATRNWISHFKRSNFWKNRSVLTLSPEFRAFFPSSGLLPMMEWSCWRDERTILEAMSLHDLALKIRQEIFTEKHEAVFQTLIICGHLHRRLKKVTEASDYFYRASACGQSLFKGYNAATVSCTTAFLEITETTTITTRTEIVTRREQLLQYVITSYKSQFGHTSDIVIKYSKVLAELYVSIKEEHKAKIIWKELQEVMITRFGKGSAEELSITGHLNIVLKRGEKQEEIIEYENELFEEVTEYEIWSLRRIEITLKLAMECEHRGDVLKAEELYITLWRGLIIHCQSEQHHYVDIEIRISMIKVSLEYVRFLRRLHRHEEASSILICIWAEYEEYDFESEEIFIQLKIVGELMRAISLLSIAVSVFKKCWSWFKAHGHEEHSSSCQILITETVEEVITKETTRTVTTTSTTTISTETIIKEIFESTISKSVVTIETISICRSLVSLYMKNEQWSEAVTILKRSLELIWRVVISGGGTIALPREFGFEAIEIAIQLAICHDRSHHFHEAESIYLRIYRACFNSCKVDDKRFTKARTELIKFYIQHGHWHRVVAIYQEILVGCRKQLGAKHEMTIRILYRLGDICHEHGHGQAHEYYEEVITALNGSSSVCHRDAFIAMKWMCTSYYEQGMWAKLKLTCEIMWETWVNHHHGVAMDAEFVELLYMRYIYILQHHSHVSYEIIRTITIQYRDTCIKVYGASVAITIRALIQLAEVCMRNEKYVHEAISYYEEVIKTTTTTTTTKTTTTSVVSTSTISSVRDKLTKAYIHVCSHGSVSTTTIERAITVLLERFESLKITLGYAHIETLTVLRELVVMYWKVKTEKTHAIVIRMLQETTIAIISKEKHSRTLYEAAKFVAGMYLRCGLHTEGRAILREIHRQIVSRTYTSSDKCGFKLDRSIGKGCYVFLVTFEEIIQGSVSISYSRIMADLLTQTVLLESYTACLKGEKNTEIILSTGAKYYCFLSTTQWTEQLTVVQGEMYTLFTKKWGTVVKTSKETTTLFLISLLQVLGSETGSIYIGRAACKSANTKIRELLQAGEYTPAYELGLCAFQFIHHQGAYHHLKNVPLGFKLSGLMALRGVSLPKPVVEEIHTKLLDLSRKIIAEVLAACRASQISFVRLKPGDLNDLVGLLGEQQNYGELEPILKALWASREVQKSWSPETITELGKRYVQALFLGAPENRARAIELCKAITYNVRRVYGALDPKAMQMSELLSQVYTKAELHKEAMRVHEEILRLVVEGDDDDEGTVDTLSPTHANRQLSMLKQSWLRNKAWDKAPGVYKDLVDALLAMPAYAGHSEFNGIKPFSQWSLKDKLDSSGEFTRPLDWEFVDPAELGDEALSSPKGCGFAHAAGKRKGMGLRRVTSDWGMNIHLLGPKREEPEKAILVKGREDETITLVKQPQLKEEEVEIKEVKPQLFAIEAEKVNGGKGKGLPPS